MNIGCHVSIAGGIFNAPLNAHNVGCEAYQIFTRSPQGGPAPKLTPEVVEQFHTENKKYGFTEYVIHTPYYINFASIVPRISKGSVSIVREELERGSLIGAQYVVTHLGSTKDAGLEVGFEKTWRGIQGILDGYGGSCKLVLEISAGAGDQVGGTFEQLADLIKNVEKDKKLKGQLGVCLDTCHVYAAGYDLRTAANVQATFQKFDDVVGLERLKFLHSNDSKFELGAHRDRHEHIGKGEITKAGWKTMINHLALKKINWYIETPPEGVADDIKTLKKLRG